MALTIAAVFLELNDHSLDAPEAEAVVIYQQLAAGTLQRRRWQNGFVIHLFRKSLASEKVLPISSLSTPFIDHVGGKAGMGRY
ncbi:MAG: hypothetical protein PVG22_19590 [Chromatiales bacterium]|jgi:hypothetical protein